MEALVVYLVFWALIGGGVGAAIGSSKGRGAAGFWLGLLLGFVGWIVVAVMEPTPDMRAARNAELAAALRSGATGSTSAVRACPWCAEDIKAQAQICRFCGRSVEPLAEVEGSSTDIAYLRDIYAREFDVAVPFLEALPSDPHDRVAWLAELCKRIEAGSPPHAAAANIPLDWARPAPPNPAVRRAAADARDAAGDWMCERCGASNLGRAIACDMCSTNRT